MELERIFKLVLDYSFKVHTGLGPGLLESAYEECLFYEPNQSGLNVQKQVAQPLIYKEVRLEAG